MFQINFVVYQQIVLFVCVVHFWSVVRCVSSRMSEEIADDKSKTTEVKQLVKNATDLQRLKLERLMKNPVS